MNIKEYSHIYFLGIGGIGMSALARYFHANNWQVSGYDKTRTKLTDSLEKEGIQISFEDDLASLSSAYRNEKNCLVIYTPAIPADSVLRNYFYTGNFNVIKRAKALGLISENSKTLGVAGTHGKTTTSTLLAHVLHQSHLGCNAFLGGISSNYNSNLILNTKSEYAVVEADEFDQSFLQLSPYASIITSTDADHLDIYGDSENMLQSFQAYANLTQANGIIIAEEKLELEYKAKHKTYSVDGIGSYNTSNIRIEDEKFIFDLSYENNQWKNIELGLPGIHNAENATAVIALCLFLGLSETEIRTGLATFKGVKRRFEYQIKSQDKIYIDDYAHHPTEIKALLKSVKLLYPTKKTVGIFQPHLFSRTQDFMQEFATELSQLDECILLPIYPARELPIEGITSEALAQLMSNKNVKVLSPEECLKHLGEIQPELTLTIGAGNIDKIIDPLKDILS